MQLTILLLLTVLFFSGCASASYHRKQVQDDSGDRVTIGTVQKKITIGMPSASVVEALGSPNMVTTDEERREVWVYDKISTNVTASVGDNAGWWVGGGASGSQSTSQKTLTIVVKFDKDSKVRDFAYHTSQF